MRFQTQGDKPEFVAGNVRSDEASATIPKGAPVVLSVDGTEDGLAVVLPSSTTAAKLNTFLFGVAVRDISAGKIGEVLRSGIHNSIVYVRQTRAASTDSFASADSAPIGAVLAINTVHNGFVSGATLGSNASANIPRMALAGTVASAASVASATSDTRLAITTTAKAFFRLL